MIEDIKGGQNCNFGYVNTNVILFGYLIYRIVSYYYVLCIELETWKKGSKKILFIHIFFASITSFLWLEEVLV